MEGAATAEICRAQLWQWLRFEAPFDDGRRFRLELFEDWLADELAALGDIPNLKPAARLLHELVTAPIEPRARLLLPLVDGQTSIADIIVRSGMQRLEAYHLLCQLLLRGLMT